MKGSIVCLVTGTRDTLTARDKAVLYNNVLTYYNEAWSSKRKFTLIVGDCPTGIDAEARKLAEEYPDIDLVVGEAERYPTGELLPEAGLDRNRWMVDKGLELKAYVRVCLAFPSPSSRGTHHCAGLAKRFGYQVTYHRVGC